MLDPRDGHRRGDDRLSAVRDDGASRSGREPPRLRRRVDVLATGATGRRGDAGDGAAGRRAPAPNAGLPRLLHDRRGPDGARVPPDGAQPALRRRARPPRRGRSRPPPLLPAPGAHGGRRPRLPGGDARSARPRRGEITAPSRGSPSRGRRGSSSTATTFASRATTRSHTSPRVAVRDLPAGSSSSTPTRARSRWVRPSRPGWSRPSPSSTKPGASASAPSKPPVPSAELAVRQSKPSARRPRAWCAQKRRHSEGARSWQVS